VVASTVSGHLNTHVDPIPKIPKNPAPDPHPPFPSPSLPPQNPPLHRPQDRITNARKPKRQRKPHIATICRVPNQLANRADIVDLGHAHDGAEDAEAESEDGGEAGGEEARVLVDGEVVAGYAAFEEEVLGYADGGVNGEPVALGDFSETVSYIVISSYLWIW